MKNLVVLSIFIAWCAGNSIPLVPGDNSHYVEGKSRYIWMSDRKGVPVLVDLREPVDYASLNSRNGAQNQYWLYTRSNPTTPQFIVNGNTNSLASSNYDASKPLIIIVHGWTKAADDVSVVIIRDAYLDNVDANVIMVDWSIVAGNNYASAVVGVPSVGQHVGSFVTWLIETTGGSWQNVHFIGFSLGAHVVGNAGRATASIPRRITGLDPAGPLWHGNLLALRSSDAQYVETINTDGGILGILEPLGHTNFYPNGGSRQPGCSDSTCNHDRAPEFFSSSLYTDHFIGKFCSTMLQAITNLCTGSTLNMGNSDLNKSGSGLYGLETGSSWPY